MGESITYVSYTHLDVYKRQLQKLDKIGNLTQVVCLSLFLTGVSVQGVSAETGFPISQSVQQTKTVPGQVVDETRCV